MAESYIPTGSSTAYTVPELTDPADAPQAFRDFADSVQNVADTLTVADVAANMTLAASDDCTMLSVDTALAAADVTVTVPDNATVPLPVGFTVAVANLGGGGFKVKLAKGPGVVIQDQGFLSVEDYRITTLVKVTTNSWLVQAGSATYTPPSGPTSATISSPAATGQYTDADGTWDYYEFTASGTLTVDTDGLAEVLIVGGGGGSGAGTDGLGGEKGGASGGGGSVFYGGINVEAGSYTVTVGGAGAAGNYQGGNGGTGGTSSIASANTSVRFPTVSGSGGSGGGGGNGAMGAQGSGHPNTGTTLSFTGSSTIYGKGQDQVNGTAAPSNLGQAGGSVGSYQPGRAGGSGVVIVRVKV